MTRYEYGPQADDSRVMSQDEVERQFNAQLLPCPFCGAGASVGLYVGPTPHITCMRCGADGPLPLRGGEQVERMHAAICGWNYRKPAPGQEKG